MNSSTSLLQLSDLHAGYAGKEVLRGLSVDIYRHEVVAILGENGAGKSTLVKTMAGLVIPTSGIITLGGQDITRAPIPVRHQLGVGYLMQGGRVFPRLTVAENLELARRHASPARAEKLNKSLFNKLAAIPHTRAGALSGGLRKMLAIQMVLSQAPNLLLLDEPTAGLTAELGEEILSTVHQYVQTRDAAAVLIEQNAAAARRHSDRVLTLVSGSTFLSPSSL